MGTASSSQQQKTGLEEQPSKIDWDNEACDIESEEDSPTSFEEKIQKFPRIEKGASKNIWEEKAYRSCELRLKKRVVSSELSQQEIRDTEMVLGLLSTMNL